MIVYRYIFEKQLVDIGRESKILFSGFKGIGRTFVKELKSVWILLSTRLLRGRIVTVAVLIESVFLGVQKFWKIPLESPDDLKKPFISGIF